MPNPNARGQMTTITHTMTQKHADQAKKIVKNWYKTKGAGEKFPMDLLCQVDGTKAGRHVLLGNGWHGSCDMRDIQQRDAFEEYINY